MKRLWNVILFVLVIIFPNFAQDIFENPEKPLSKNAGRIVELKEVLRIDDTGGDYYFQYPRNLKVAPDGSLFIMDVDQLIRFDSSGKFLHNFFKNGQGPGEMQWISNYFFSENILIIHDRRLQKIMRFDFTGEFIREFRIHELPSFSRLHFHSNNANYFFGQRIPSTDGKARTLDVPNDLFFVAKEGQEIKNLLTFPVESFVVSIGENFGMISIGELITMPFREKFIIISHTQDYLIKIFDVETQKIIRSFMREYEKVKVPESRQIGRRIMMGGKTYTVPRKYSNDILKFMEFKGSLWVMTSSFDEDKGILIDVFNFEGQYIDNFYIKFPEEINLISLGDRPMTISGEYLFMIVRNEDDTYSIKKYQIEDKTSKPNLFYKF